MLEVGFEVDRYVVEEQLGEGGMAVVYRVRHQTLGTRHALKVLTIASRDVKERLIQEGRVQATLNHNNIVGVSDVIDVAGSPGLLMEFIQGPALDHWLYHYQPSIEEALVLFRAIVAGVGHAHAMGLIHRDLKPANVLLHLDDRGLHPKVADFGLAKLTTHANLKRTRTGTTMGTPAYMAPEQIRDASTVDRRADLYSLGCILYELVCGVTPYQDDDIIELFAKVAAGDYPSPTELRPDLPKPVVDAIDGLLETNRDFRVADCQAVLEILGGADKGNFTQPFALNESTLPDPRPMRAPGETILGPDTTAMAAARKFIRPIVTPVPPPARSEPSGGSALVFGDDPGTTPLVLEGPDRQGLPVNRSFRTTLLFFLLFGLAVFVAAVLTTAVLGVVGVGLLPATTAPPITTIPDPPSEPDPQPDPGPQPDPTGPEPTEPEPVEPEPTEPEPAEPAPQQPEPARPEPATPAPTPDPVQPEPEPTAVATIAVTGQIESLTFTGGAGTFEHTARIPPGEYSMMVKFPGSSPVPTGKITLREGPNTLNCDQTFLQCSRRR